MAKKRQGQKGRRRDTKGHKRIQKDKKGQKGRKKDTKGQERIKSRKSTLHYQ
ncbi:MAG: hypothetical protein QM737_16085 [Ferruginibacter sp.]